MANISEDKVVATWLKAEFQSSRFSARLNELLEEVKENADFLLEPDLVNHSENVSRKKLLLAHRPYLENDRQRLKFTRYYTYRV